MCTGYRRNMSYYIEARYRGIVKSKYRDTVEFAFNNQWDKIKDKGFRKFRKYYPCLYSYLFRGTEEDLEESSIENFYNKETGLLQLSTWVNIVHNSNYFYDIERYILAPITETVEFYEKKTEEDMDFKDSLIDLKRYMDN
jgi:hypothetical protein